MADGAVIRALADLVRCSYDERLTASEEDRRRALVAEARVEYDGLREASDLRNRGRRINRRATLGARVVVLRAMVPDLEKTARKTPPRTLTSERARVAAAKVALGHARAELAEVEREWARLCVTEGVTPMVIRGTSPERNEAK